ncbi:hypothetical protein FKM82_027858 [Ascaphus truei]
MGVWYHRIITLYAFSLKVVHMELLEAAKTMFVHSSSSNTSPMSVSHLVIYPTFSVTVEPEPVTSLYICDVSPFVDVPERQSFSKFVNWDWG